ncbi:MAG TPA: hypothetical protein VLE23_10545 [Geminicoccaceae bacterium]|nr:hypothetical protein [Geminicoccaceae bacterium]
MPPTKGLPGLAGFVCGLALIACAGCATQLAGEPGLAEALKRHYDARATEEGGLCATPELDLVTSSSLQEQTADRLVVRVSYAYSDPVGQASGQCRGFGTRTFTLAKGADGFEVLEMTGPRREGIRVNRIDDSDVW